MLNLFNPFGRANPRKEMERMLEESRLSLVHYEAVKEDAKHQVNKYRERIARLEKELAEPQPAVKVQPVTRGRFYPSLTLFKFGGKRV